MNAPMIRIWIDEEGIVRLKTSGRLDPAVILEAHQRFYAENWDDFASADRHLADYRGCDVTDVSAEAIRAVAASNLEVARLRPPLRLAVLIDDGVEYGLARMWEQYATPTGWPLKLFTDEDAAWSWLRDGQA